MEVVGKRQLKRVLALFMFSWGAAMGFQIANLIAVEGSHGLRAGFFSVQSWASLRLIIVTACAVAGYFLASTVVRAFSFSMAWVDDVTRRFSWQELSSTAMGLVAGLIVANLLALPLWGIPFGKYPAVLLNLILGSVGACVFLRRRREAQPSEKGEGTARTWAGAAPAKILDTSVIVDGRVLDVARTGFLDGTLVIPEFVLHELQGIADSSDPLRRMRGRRGLDVVNELQNLDGIAVEISQLGVRELGVESVDSALLALGKQMHAAVLTTDYNLLKVAQIHDVSVLNINDLANAIKPILLPGDFIRIDVIREGKDTAQGVGYLDDGTMCVVEDGAPYIGQKVEIMVTSMLQTSAGRMIFGRTRKEAVKE